MWITQAAHGLDYFGFIRPLGSSSRRGGTGVRKGGATHRTASALDSSSAPHLHTLPSLPSFPHTLLPRRRPPGRTWCRHSSAVWMSMVSYRPSIGMRGIAGHLRGERGRCAHTVATDRGDGHLPPPPPASPLWRTPPRHRHDLPLCRDTGWSGFHLKYQGEYRGSTEFRGRFNPGHFTAEPESAGADFRSGTAQR